MLQQVIVETTCVTPKVFYNEASIVSVNEGVGSLKNGCEEIILFYIGEG